MSAAGIVSLGINNIVIGFLSGMLGYVIDFMIGQTTLFNLSHGTLTTINYLVLAFIAFPFAFLFISVINYIITSASEAPGYG